MDRGRVVDRAGDPFGLEVAAQLVAMLGADDVEVVDVVTPLGDDRRGDQGLGEPLPRFATALVGLVEVAELDVQDRCLEAVETVGAGGHLVVVAGALAVGAEQADLLGDLLVVGDKRAAVAPRPEVLGRVEAEAADVAERAGPLALVDRNTAGCEAQFRAAFLMGCVGAWSLHPVQIGIAKKVCSPPPDEVVFAKKVLEAIPDGRGVHMIDGKMQDDATWKQCKVMVELAEMLAAKDPD